MIVPEFWAEARIQQKTPERQITVLRYGWSDISQTDAQQQADQRARETFDRIAAGEKIPRRERKVRYNGSDGHPIREQIVSRYGDNVVTRNSYGARCLNSPDVLFADIDYPGSIAGNSSIILMGLALGSVTSIAFLFLVNNWLAARIAGCCSFFLFAFGFSFLVDFAYQSYIKLVGGMDRMIVARIEKFARNHPDWHLRVYQSPNGYRLLAMHQTFDPRSELVNAAFRKLRVDPVYTIMCQKQNCFRARLTGKPWRMGFESEVRLSRAMWPIAEPLRAQHERWVAEYEAAATDFAACRYLGAYGATHPTCKAARAVCDIHDSTCKSHEDLPLA